MGASTVSDPTCLSLLERAKKGQDPETWNRFVRSYSPLIRKWLARHGVNDQDAEDIGQNVMMVVLRELPNFEHNARTGAFRCWLRTITVNRLRTLWRARERDPDALGGSDYIKIAEEFEDPNSRLSVEWNAQHNRHVCERLLEMVRGDFAAQTIDAFRRVTFEERKAPQVAAELGMSATAVRIARSRVLARLRKLGEGLLELP